MNLDLEDLEFNLLESNSKHMYFDGVTLRDLDNNIITEKVDNVKQVEISRLCHDVDINHFLMNKMLYIMSTINSDKVVNSRICNLIYNLPYIAGANNPGRFAISHLMTFLQFIFNEDNFSHYERDNMYIDETSAIIENYCGGDRLIERKGAYIIALFFLDMLKENPNIKDNPIPDKWNYEEERAKLVLLVESVKCEEIDKHFNYDESLTKDTILS